MFETIVFIVCVILFYQAYKILVKQRLQRREKFINTYQFPEKIGDKVLETYPHLNSENLELIYKGLRDYFHISNFAGKRMISMPSQVVDVAWHEFILFTREYEVFCQKAFGHFLHHTPAEAMKNKKIAQQGIKITWKIACVRESINPKKPSKLPLLFTIDALLEIPDGFRYSLNCSSNNDYCASHISCSGNAAGCGGCISCGSSSSSGGNSGCGSGCGGS